MTSLDIFATNIIGNNAVLDFTAGENGNRWIKISSPSNPNWFSNFFIVKKLSPIDSQSVSSAIDSTTGTSSKLTFDNNVYAVRVRIESNLCFVTLQLPHHLSDFLL